MNSLVVSDAFAAGFGAILADAAWKSSVLMVLAAVAMRCIRRGSAATRHLALAAAIASLLVLPLLSWGLPRLEVLPAWIDSATLAPSAIQSARVASFPASAPTTHTEPLPLVANQPPRPNVPTAPLENAAPDTTDARARSDARFKVLWPWAPVVWLVGAFCAWIPALVGVFSLRRLERQSHLETSGVLFEGLQRLTTNSARDRRIRILTAASRSMPMTWGVFQPRILLPAEAADWPAQRLRIVLLHELAHIRRGDFVTTLCVRFVCSLYWFNPLVWLAGRRLRAEQERACDDAVLSAGAVATGYAEEVLRIAAGPAMGRLEAFGAVAMARASGLEQRLLAILDGARSRRGPTRMAAAVTIFLTSAAVVSMSMLRAGQNPAPATSATAPASVANPAALAPAELNRGLIAWWRGDGDGKDSAGKHDGEFPFGIRYLPGRIGEAFDFRRTYAIEDILQRVSIPDSPDFALSETMTLEAWIYPVRFGGVVLLRGDDRPGFDTWQLDLVTPGKISFSFDSVDNKSAEILAPIQLRQWQHVVATFEHGVMKLYVNGVRVAEAQTDLRPNPTLDARYDPALGIGDTGGKRYSIPFDGLIDEVKIYNRALNEAEVTESMKR